MEFGLNKNVGTEDLQYRTAFVTTSNSIAVEVVSRNCSAMWAFDNLEIAQAAREGSPLFDREGFQEVLGG